MPTTVRLEPPVEDALKRLKTALESDEGRKASRDEIACALIWGTTPAQAAGMLIAYTRETAD